VDCGILIPCETKLVYYWSLVLHFHGWLKKNAIEYENGSVKESIGFAKRHNFGRPKGTYSLTEELKEAFERWKLNEIPAVNAMQEIGLKKTTFYKLVREYEESYSPTNFI
jgi:predicted ArsR family transcriptional regulator